MPDDVLPPREWADEEADLIDATEYAEIERLVMAGVIETEPETPW